MNHLYKKFVATAATATLVATAIVPAASASFSDVDEKHEFATYINAAVDAGYIKGYANGTFGINDNLKRSQVVIIIGRYLEKLGYSSKATTSPWSDVTNEEVIKYGNIVKDAGVFTGYANGTLNGGGLITRENMAVVLDRLAKTVTGTSLAEVAKDIQDAKIADLAIANPAYQGAIQALRDLEISTAKNFNPKGNVKRGQFAKFIVTAVEKIDAIAPEEVAPEEVVENDKAELAKEVALEALEKAVNDGQEAVDTAADALSEAVYAATDAAYDLSKDSTLEEIRAAQVLVDAAKSALVGTETAITTAQKAIADATAKAISVGVAQEDIESIGELDPSYANNEIATTNDDIATINDLIKEAQPLVEANKGELAKEEALEALENAVIDGQEAVDTAADVLSEAVYAATDAAYDLSEDSTPEEIRAAQALVDAAKSALVGTETAITTAQKAIADATAKATLVGVAQEDIESAGELDPSYANDEIATANDDIATANDSIQEAQLLLTM